MSLSTRLVRARTITGLALVLALTAVPGARGEYAGYFTPVSQGTLVTGPFYPFPGTFFPGRLEAFVSARGESMTPSVAFDMNQVSPNSEIRRAELLFFFREFEAPTGLNFLLNVTYGFDTTPNYSAPLFLQTAGPSGPAGTLILPPTFPDLVTVTLDITSILFTQRQLGGRYLKFFGLPSPSGSYAWFNGVGLGIVPEPPTALLAALGLVSLAAARGWRHVRRRAAGQKA